MGSKNTPTQTTTTTNTIPANVSANYDYVANAAKYLAQKPYTPYTGEGVAGLNADQTAAIGQIGQAATAGQPYTSAAYSAAGAAVPTATGYLNNGLDFAGQSYSNGINSAADYLNGGLGQAAGMYGSGIGAATGYYGQGLDSAASAYGQGIGQAAGMYGTGLDMAGSYYGQGINQATGLYGTGLGQASGVMGQGLGVAAGYVGQGMGVAGGYLNAGAQAPSQADIERYMSPYNQDVIDATRANMNQNNAIQQNGVLGTAISGGYFGGDRAGIAASDLARQQSMADNQTIAGLYNQNYSQALGQANTVANRQLQAGQTAGSLATSAGLGLGNLYNQSGAQMGSLYGQAAGALGGLYNSAASGYGSLYGQAGSALGGLYGQEGSALGSLYGQAGSAVGGLYGQAGSSLGSLSGQAASTMGGLYNSAASGYGGLANQAGLGLGGLDTTSANTYGSLGNQAFTQAEQGAAANLAAGTLQQQNQQQQDTYQKALYDAGQQYPFQTTSWLSGILTGMGNQGSTSATTSPAASTTSQIAGAATAGVGILGATGAFGSTGWLSTLSDARTKDNIQPIGMTFDGQPIHRFNYKGDPRTQIGLVAQETAQSHPDAVAPMNASGVLGVNYDLATRDAASRGHFADGGWGHETFAGQDEEQGHVTHPDTAGDAVVAGYTIPGTGRPIPPPNTGSGNGLNGITQEQLNQLLQVNAGTGGTIGGHDTGTGGLGTGMGSSFGGTGTTSANWGGIGGGLLGGVVGGAALGPVGGVLGGYLGSKLGTYATGYDPNTQNANARDGDIGSWGSANGVTGNWNTDTSVAASDARTANLGSYMDPLGGGWQGGGLDNNNDGTGGLWKRGGRVGLADGGDPDEEDDGSPDDPTLPTPAATMPPSPAAIGVAPAALPAPDTMPAPGGVTGKTVPGAPAPAATKTAAKSTKPAPAPTPAAVAAASAKADKPATSDLYTPDGHGLSDQDKWLALTMAGLGIMGGTSPQAGVNIGQGAQKGIEYLTTAKAANLNQARADLEAKRLEEQAAQHKEDLALRTQQLAISQQQANQTGGYYDALRKHYEIADAPDDPDNPKTFKDPAAIATAKQLATDHNERGGPDGQPLKKGDPGYWGLQEGMSAARLDARQKGADTMAAHALDNRWANPETGKPFANFDEAQTYFRRKAGALPAAPVPVAPVPPAGGGVAGGAPGAVVAPPASPAPPARPAGVVPPPAPPRPIAPGFTIDPSGQVFAPKGFQYNPALRQYRDPSSGQVFDEYGRPVQ